MIHLVCYRYTSKISSHGIQLENLIEIYMKFLMTFVYIIDMKKITGISHGSFHRNFRLCLLI